MPLDSINRCRFELFVSKLLSRFHNAHDRSVEVMFAVVFDRSIGALRFFGLVIARRLNPMSKGSEKRISTYRNFSLNRVDMHFRVRVVEISVELEHISVVDIFARRYLFQNFLFSTSKTLQRPPQFRSICSNEVKFRLRTISGHTHPYSSVPSHPGMGSQSIR